MPFDPPPITIVDPNAPDVVGEEHDPWRPSRRLVTVTAAVLLVAGLITGAVLAVQHHRHGQALDRAALRNIKLAVSLTPGNDGQVPDGAAQAVQLQVYNYGSHVVHLRTIRVDGGAPIPVQIGSDVLPGATVSVPVPTGTTCTASTGRVPRHEVSIAVTTYRGGRTTWSNVVPDASEFINISERQRCGTLLPDEALQTSVVDIRKRNGWIEVTFDLDNFSTLPLTILRLDPPSGIRMEATGLPLAMPAARTPGLPGGSRRLTVRLTVSSCDQLRAVYEQITNFGTSLRASLRGPNEEGTATLGLDELINPQNPPPGGVIVSGDMALKEQCPAGYFFG